MSCSESKILELGSQAPKSWVEERFRGPLEAQGRFEVFFIRGEAGIAPRNAGLLRFGKWGPCGRENGVGLLLV